MNIITLTTDWHQGDYYTGAVKGKILSLCPHARIVDIAHDIPAFNQQKAAFILRNTWSFFPKGTVHIVGLQAESEEEPLIIAHEGQYFIMADTGLAGLLFPDGPGEVYRIPAGEKTTLFPVLDQFVPVACALVSGKKPKELGQPTEEADAIHPMRAAIEEGIITGLVIYIDSYGNAITNITKETFDRVGGNRPFEIYPGTGSSLYRITRLNQHYYETPPGDILALFNSLDLLEIAIYHGNAGELLGLDINSSIRVKFKK